MTGSHRLWFISLVIFFLIASCSSRKPLKSKLHTSIQVGDLEVHIKNLKPAQQQVRETGSPQEAIAAHYISNVFNIFGLAPLGDDDTYYQNYTIKTGVNIGSNGNRIQFANNKFSSRFNKIIPWPNSSSGKVEGVLAWMGYGTSSGTYNDYRHIDVNGKVVLLVRCFPYGMSHSSNPNAYKVLAKKIEIAQKEGAVAVIIAPGQQAETITKYFTLDKYNPAINVSKIPVMQVSNRIARQMLAAAGLNFDKLQTQIDRNHVATSKITNLRVQVDVNLKNEINNARNIVSLIRGSKYPRRYIVITAPYDYNRAESGIGSGLPGNNDSSSTNPQMSIAGLLELAQYFSAHKAKNSLIFTALSGNNFGRMGLHHFWQDPPVPPDEMLAIINMQNINRVSQDSLYIYGIKSAKGWNRVLSGANSGKIPIRTFNEYSSKTDTLKLDPQDVPMIRLVSRRLKTHASNKNDSQGVVKTLHYIARVIRKIDDNQKDTKGFSASNLTLPGIFHMPKVTLGIMPDYYFRGEGLRIRFVSQGGPAYNAGIKTGDIITSLNGKKVTNLDKYIVILNHLKKGEHTTVTISRNGKKLKLPIQF